MTKRIHQNLVLELKNKIMTSNQIYILKKKYFNQINDFICKTYNDFHLELFHEEYDIHYDSNSDSTHRKNEINPMAKDYIEEYKKKREKLNISHLNENGTPNDNSSMIYIEKEIDNHILNFLKNKDYKQQNKFNISGFFKQQKNDI